MPDQLQSIIAKLNREESYYEERVKLIFRVVYRDPENAYEKLKAFQDKHGYEKTNQKLSEKPHFFGKLRGRLTLGFMKSKERSDAELAIKDVFYHVKKLHTTRLQLQEANRIFEQEQAEKRQRELQNQRQSTMQSSHQAQIR